MHVLVATASRHGATREIGDAIAASLQSHGVAAESLEMRAVEALAGYDAVVLGSAIYLGKWLEPARAFVDAHELELGERPTWLFSSGPLGDPPKPDEDHAVLAVDVLVERIHAREHRLFRGKLDRDELGLGERTIARVVRTPEGDFRDWEAIDAWSASIARTLTTTPPRPAAP